MKHEVDKFSKNTQISNLIKILPMEAELFHAERRTEGQTDRQTDMTKLIVAFRNFAKATKNSKFCPQKVLMCFIPSYEQTAIHSQYSVNFVFMTKTEVFTTRYDRDI
jgi:hypothetical protein